LTQVAAARVLRISHPDVAKMLKGHFCPFSAERRMRLFGLLGSDIEVGLRPVPQGTAITVKARKRVD
jgi:hypothetical protein